MSDVHRPLKAVKDEFGVVHIASDGYDDGLGKPNNDPWFARCEVSVGFGFGVTWTSTRFYNLVDEQPNCMACLAVVRD